MKDLILEDVYIYLLERTIRQIKKRFNAKLKALNPDLSITSDQWVILKRISERDTITQRDVAQITFKDPASITRTIDLLERKGWIVREAVQGDRRAYQLTMTKAGWKLVEIITPLAQEVREEGLAGIPKKDFAVLKKTLNKMYENVS
ncbi:MAG: MarR family transcriptional regulator [Bacteroidota bacterium]